MYSIIISLIVYVISAYYIGKFMSDYLPSGPTRKLAVFITASFVSWLVGSGIDLAFPAQAINLF